jgi:hypothetical protein
LIGEPNTELVPILHIVPDHAQPTKANAAPYNIAERIELREGRLCIGSS